VRPTRIHLAALALCLSAQPLPSPATANGERPAAPGAAEFEDALPEGASLTGREIYERFLENRYRKSLQQMRVVSEDPGGSSQTTVFTVALEDHRDAEDRATDGVLAKMLIEVSHPFDMRHTAYLMSFNEPGPDDEFVYQPSARRVRRVNLKKTPLMGPDYTFDDVVYHDIENAEYVRLPDAVIGATPVYVVEARIEETRDVEYHRTVSYLEKEHYVPLRVRYWDDYGVEVKEMTASAATIRAFGDAWVATESTMRDLLQRTTSTLLVDDMDLEPSFAPDLFSLARLDRRH
jgi:hypothetical protein